MPAWTPVWKPAPVVVKPAVVTPAAAVAVKGVASAASASSTQSVTITGNSNVVNFENNTINNSATSVAVNVNAAVAWGNSTAKNVIE
jgi:azurin